MRRIFSKRDLNVFQLRLEHWPYDRHTHNFYELILINEGNGTHSLNNCSFEYEAGDIFLLSPEDDHVFEINKRTVFTYVKFTERIFREDLGWTRDIQSILYRPNTIPKSIVSDGRDRCILFQLGNMLLEEFSKTGLYSEGLRLNLFGAFIAVVARSLSCRDASASKADMAERSKVNKVLSYIRQYVGENQKISLKVIAEKFHISPNYVSVYLKKHTGNGLQNIINETRLEVAEHLLKQSKLTINEVADKAGFSDASHMNKMFQKYRKANPSQLR